jgi:hypothetical protein
MSRGEGSVMGSVPRRRFPAPGRLCKHAVKGMVKTVFYIL